MAKSFLWTRLVPLLGALIVPAGLAAFFLTYDEASETLAQDSFPYWVHLVLVVVFAGTAALLLVGGRRDRRAVSLGAFLLAIATAWCNRPLRLAGEYDVPGASLFSFLNSIELDCFLPLFIWAFVRDFSIHTLSVRQRRWIDRAVALSAGIGLLFFAANLLAYLGRKGFPPAILDFLYEFSPQRSTGIYYGVLIACTAAAFPVLWSKARSVQEPEQRRARIFLQGLVIGFSPLLADVLLDLLYSPYNRFLDDHPRFNLGMTAATLLPTTAVALLTSYSVLVHRVLDVKLIARRAIQYALARYSVLALAATPLLALLYYIYANRSETVSDLFNGPRFPVLLAASCIGIAALRYRRSLLDSIDRRYFREQYDARRILTDLVDKIRSVNEIPELAKLVSREVDAALHLENVAFLALEARSSQLIDPRNRSRRLDASSELAVLATTSSEPLDVTLEGSHNPFTHLPEAERHWLVDNGLRLIVPILARDGSPLGIIGLGEKKSGLPFLHEDRRLLHAIAGSAAWVLEAFQSFSTSHTPRPWRPPLDDTTAATPPAIPATELARECPKCQTVHQSFMVLCPKCSRRLETSHVPYVLPGKFRFERRIGIGGMGVVYRGSDLALGRAVAVKTLRRVSPEDAMRLRREARTAAAVAHLHLAAVYNMETWQGTPMLVMELLEGGTLAQRFEGGKLTVFETVELGIAMTDALAHLHAADILHRDIKPSNIGFTRNGVPKLMDFGIARLMFDLRREGDLDDGLGIEDSTLLSAGLGNPTPSPNTISKQLVGTLSYLSPEALSHRPADVSFDLWGLAIVLYECLLGRKVFTGTDVRQTINRIKGGRVPDFSQVCPDYDPVLGDFFRTALHPSVTRRPPSALDMKRRLMEVRARLE